MRSMATGLADNCSSGFCPFCGEYTEGRADCPVHELTLVPWDQSQDARDKQVSGWMRLLLRLGVLSWISGFFLNFVTIHSEAVVSATAYRLASTRAYNLWTVLLAAAAVLVVLLRRRSQADLYRARVALIIIASMPLVAVVYTLWGVLRWSTSQSSFVSINIGPGAYVIALGSLVCVLCSIAIGKRIC